MTNSPDTQTGINAQRSGEVLRQRFILLAQCAAEASNDVNDETALAAAMMADLLTIAAMLRDDSASRERADEIVEFCQQRALPLLTDSATDEASQKSILQEANNRWSEYLTLLSPEERCLCRRAPGCIAEVDSGWHESLQADVSERSHATDLEPDVIHDNRTHQPPLDIAGILASLVSESAPSCNSTLCSADAEKRSMGSKPGENQSDFAMPDADDHTLPTPPGELETIDDPEMAAAYADDAQQCIAEMEASLLTLESGQASDDALRCFCRQLHTLKGASGTVGLSRLAKYLHDLESYIERTTGCSIDVDKLLDCVDAVRAQLSALGISSTGVTIAASSPQAVSELHAPSQPRSPSRATGSDTEFFVRVEASRLERLMDLLAELVMLRNRRDTYVDSLRNIHRELNYCAARTRTLTSTIEYSTPATAAGGGSPQIESERSTPKTRLLSRTLDEISKDTAELGRSLQEVFDPLSDDNSAVSHLIGQFRQELMDLRRLPIGGLFQRLQRVVRDAAKSEGKLVEVHFEGQGARAERAVQDRLFEPLLHLVRNAVSHGLDTPDGRMKTGKPAVGRITLAARSDATSLCIEVRDDGRGLNDEALEARGRELGLLPRGESVSRSQLWKLIFHPGFSTKSAVSEISGRGVGMDVVDSWVKRLRGRIDVESVPGLGTTIRLHIPLRSAVEHAMVVRAGGQLFALPMHTVSGTSDSKRTMRSLANAASDTQVIPLSRLLGYKENHTTRGCYISLRSTSGPSHTPQHSADKDVTIAVDAIIGVEEVVVRSLPPLLQRNEFFAGVTLSGRAETVLLLDVRKVMDLCQRTELPADQSTKTAAAIGESLKHANERCVLIVDDSVVVRRSLSRKLRAVGCEVREAANGREAMVALHAGGITAVVTDLDMPKMTGVELLQEIRRQKQFKTIPVTVLTSRDDESLLSEIRQLHSAVILNKPVTDGTVKAIMDALSCSAVMNS